MLKNKIAVFSCCMFMVICLISVFPVRTQAEEAAQPSAIAILEEETIPAPDAPVADEETAIPGNPVTAEEITSITEEETAPSTDTVTIDEKMESETVFSTMAAEDKTEVNSASFMSPTLLFLPENGNAATLTMPTDILVKYNTSTLLRNRTAEWDFKSFDASQTGRQYITGVVSLPEGFAYYDADGAEVELTIKQPVWVYSDDMAEREVVDTDGVGFNTGSYLILPVGSSNERVQDSLRAGSEDTALMMTNDDLRFRCDAYWNADLVDTSVPGIYFPYTIETPPGIVISDEYLYGIGMMFFVVDPDAVDLSCVYWDTATSNRFRGRWLYRAANPALWVTDTSPFDEKQEAAWHEFDSYDEELTLNDIVFKCSLSGTSLGLWFFPEDGALRAMEGEYWFQIRYDGGQSNYLYVRLEDNNVVEFKPTIGDRIGDTDGNKNPPGEEEPEPPTPENPTPQPPTPEKPIPQPPTPENPILQPPSPEQPNSEEASDTSNGNTSTPTGNGVVSGTQSGGTLSIQNITIGTSAQTEQAADPTQPASLDGLAFTGAQLRALMAVKPDYVPFVQDDVEVWIPTGALAMLEFSDDDVIAVRMDYAPGQSLTIFVTLNNQNISLSESFLVGIPWDGGEAQWQDAAGNPVLCEYDDESGRLLLTFTQPGTIYLVHDATEEKNIPDQQVPLAGIQTPPTDPPAAGEYPYVATIIVLIGCCGAGVAFVYFRRRRLRQ